MQKEYLLERLSVNKLNPTKIKKQLRLIKKEIEANKTLAVQAKFKGRLKPELCTDGPQNNYRYSMRITLSKEGDRAEEALDLSEKVLRKAASLQKWLVPGEAEAITVLRQERNVRPPMMSRPLTDDILNSNFFEIVGRDAHLRTIHDATELFIRTKKQMRTNTLLYGEPGAAKTSMFLLLKDFYEQEVPKIERVRMLDATATSKAGLENLILDLAENGELPDILCLEEIEKFDMNILLPLGSLMDGRGVIQKLNARVDRKQNAYMLVWATCNDEKFVREWKRGFLWSRFGNRIECVRPTREEMEHTILPQKVSAMNGNLDWVKPACDFAYDALKTNDPREIMAVLAGMDRLLDGSYQKDRMAIINAATAGRQRSCAVTESREIFS